MDPGGRLVPLGSSGKWRGHAQLLRATHLRAQRAGGAVDSPGREATLAAGGRASEPSRTLAAPAQDVPFSHLNCHGAPALVSPRGVYTSSWEPTPLSPTRGSTSAVKWVSSYQRGSQCMCLRSSKPRTVTCSLTSVCRSISMWPRPEGGTAG